MERFAIKIDKPLKSRMKALCRLCGIDNPNQTDILQKNTNWSGYDEPTLSDKIYQCVGIQVYINLNLFRFFFFFYLSINTVVASIEYKCNECQSK